MVSSKLKVILAHWKQEKSNTEKTPVNTDFAGYSRGPVYITLITTVFFDFFGSFLDMVHSKELNIKQSEARKMSNCSCFDIFHRLENRNVSQLSWIVRSKQYKSLTTLPVRKSGDIFNYSFKNIST